jgi:predicted XRE-type DNA-binding protein
LHENENDDETIREAAAEGLGRRVSHSARWSGQQTSLTETVVSHTTPSDGNVFADIGFPPVEAENLKIRSDLMGEIRRLISGMTQTDAASRLGVSQPRVSELVRDQIEMFTIDSLVNMLAHAGMRLRVSVDKRRRPAA